MGGDVTLIEALDDSDLSTKQKLFVRYYLGEAHYNGVKAMRLAGYTGTENSLMVEASRSLRNPKIKRYIAEALDEKAMTPGQLIAMMSDAATGIGAYLKYDENAGQPYVDYPALLADGKGHLVKGIRYGQKGSVTVDFVDPQAARVDLARILKLFGDERAQVKAQILNLFLGVMPEEIRPQFVQALEQWSEEEEQ